MKKIALIGYGELGKQIHALARIIYHEIEVVAFDDVYFQREGKIEGGIVFHPFGDYRDESFKSYSFFICLGYKHLLAKKGILEWLLGNNYELPSLIHPTAFINETAVIGKAVYIYPMCNVDKGVKVGDGVLINNSVVVSHDTIIGKCCYLSPCVVTSGLVNIHECTFIGAGTIISNGITIGSGAVIGLGTVVTKDLPNECSAIGYPAKILSKKLNLE